MRNLQLFKTLFFLGILATVISSCGGDPEKKPVKNGVDAEILNLDDSTLLFYSVVSPLDEIRGKGPDFSLEIEVDSNGIFVRPLDLIEGYYYLEYDHVRSLYFIQNGKRLSLDFDAKKPSVKPDFSGKLKYESRYLYDRYLAHAQFMAKQNTYYAYSDTDFIAQVNGVRGKLDTALVMYVTNHPTGSTYFMEQESLTNLYFSAAYLEAYAVKRSASSALSEGYYDGLNTLNVNDPKGLNNPAFFNYIHNYVWARSGTPANMASTLKQIAFVDSAITDFGYQDYLRFEAAKEVTTWEPSLERTAMLDTLTAIIHDQEIQSFLRKNIQNDTAAMLLESHVILEDQ